MGLKKIPKFDEVKEWSNAEFAVNTDLINQKERIDQLRINLALDGVGMEDALYENFVDSENIIGTGGINLVTGSNGYVEVEDFINIDETITSSSNYSYDKHPKMDISDLTVEVTGVSNVESVTDTLEAVGATTQQDVTIGGNTEPANAELTLSGGISENVTSLDGTVIDQTTEPLNLVGNQEPEASITMSNPESKVFYHEVPGVEGGDTFEGSSRGHNFEFETDIRVVHEVTVTAQSTTLDYMGGHDHKVYLEDEYIGEFYAPHRDADPVTETLYIEGGYEVENNSPLEVEIYAWSNDDKRESYVFDVELVSYPPEEVNVTGSDTPVPVDGTTELDINTDIDEIEIIPESGSIDYALEVVDRNAPIDPFVSFGGEFIEYDGVLMDDITESVTLEAGETYTASSGTDDGEATVLVSRDERTDTADPSVWINGQTADHSGTLDEGQTVSLDANKSWVSDGNNTISINLNDPTVGPEMRVGATIKATTGKGVVELGEFNTDYVIAEMIASNTIENGAKEDVNIVVKDQNGNEFVIDNTNIDNFVQPSFDGQNANVTLELLNYGSQLTEVSLFTNDTVEQL